MRFPQPFIDEVRHAADIVAVVQDYVSLRKTGATYKGLCPFHGEKTPSFHVNRDKGFFHCFGCGVGGDVFKFLELQERLGFTDAVRELARRFGVPIPEMEAGDGPGQAESAAEREALIRMHEAAAEYFAEHLQSPAGAKVLAYLRGPRGLSAETIGTLRLGWAPPSRDGLLSRLRQRQFPAPLIARSGLVVSRDDGTLVDRFRNRLMVPILRDTGSIVAFGGRALEAEQVPKYLNSPETPVYTKSRMLYGLNFTKPDLRSAGFVVIVEGYFDFAQVFQAGRIPVVATCGTALTPQQAQLLRRFASKAIINFDPDGAGQTAAERSSELLVAAGFVVNVVRLPGGQDPDAFVQARGREAYVEQLRQSQPYLDFLLDRAASGRNLAREDDRRDFLQQMLGVAARIPDPAVRDQFADRLAHKARVTEGVVREEIRRAAAARRTEVPAAVSRPAGAGQALREAERGLLWALVHEPAGALAAIRSLEPQDLEGLASSGILLAAASTRDVADEDVPAALLERLKEGEAQVLSRVAAEPHPPTPDLQAFVGSCVQALRTRRLKQALADLDTSFREALERGADAGHLADLHAQKIAIKRHLDEA